MTEILRINGHVTANRIVAQRSAAHPRFCASQHGRSSAACGAEAASSGRTLDSGIVKVKKSNPSLIHFRSQYRFLTATPASQSR
eukprot:4132549-Pleurochrysis_carterae.AAC.1